MMRGDVRRGYLIRLLPPTAKAAGLAVCPVLSLAGRLAIACLVAFPRSGLGDFSLEWTLRRNFLCGYPGYLNLAQSLPIHFGPDASSNLPRNPHPPTSVLLALNAGWLWQAVVPDLVGRQHLAPRVGPSAVLTAISQPFYALLGFYLLLLRRLWAVRAAGVFYLPDAAEVRPQLVWQGPHIPDAAKLGVPTDGGRSHRRTSPREGGCSLHRRHSVRLQLRGPSAVRIRQPERCTAASTLTTSAPEARFPLATLVPQTAHLAGTSDRSP